MFHKSSLKYTCLCYNKSSLHKLVFVATNLLLYVFCHNKSSTLCFCYNKSSLCFYYNIRVYSRHKFVFVTTNLIHTNLSLVQHIFSTQTCLCYNKSYPHKLVLVTTNLLHAILTLLRTILPKPNLLMLEQILSSQTCFLLQQK